MGVHVHTKSVTNVYMQAARPVARGIGGGGGGGGGETI